MPQSTPFTATVWKDSCQVVDEGEAASAWLARALPEAGPLRLVRMHLGSQRPQSKPELLGTNTYTFFADAAPFLIANQASLEDLNRHLTHYNITAVTMERFRPNIVLGDLNAFAEHRIHSLAHNNYQFTLCYPCQRCVIPTIDIDSGLRHPQQQPFSLLAEINAMPDNAKAPAFGENAILASGDNAQIAVGDTLKAQYQS